MPACIDGAIVLDIGSHIGAFSALCKERGAAECWGVEACVDNVRVGLKNVNEAPGSGAFQTFWAAAWRSDSRGGRAFFTPAHVGHTGNGVVSPGAGELQEVPTICLDDLLKMASDFGRRRVDYLKIDCEGAEWPILFSARGLQLVDHLLGEYHASSAVLARVAPYSAEPPSAWNLDGLAALLRHNGFEPSIDPPNFAWHGHFQGHRSGFGRPT